jgi:hypothetical protein
LTAVVALTAGFLLIRTTPPAAPAAGPNTLDTDPAATDPCSAISINSLTAFGQPFIDLELYGFASGVVTTTITDGSGQVQATLELTGPAAPSVSAIGPRSHGPHRAARGLPECRWAQHLAGRHQQDHRDDPLGDLSRGRAALRRLGVSAVRCTARAHQRSLLEDGPGPRRRGFASRSLFEEARGHADAPSALTGVFRGGGQVLACFLTRTNLALIAAAASRAIDTVSSEVRSPLRKSPAIRVPKTAPPTAPPTLTI